MLNTPTTSHDAETYQKTALVPDLLNSRLTVIRTPPHRGKTHFAIYLTTLLAEHRKTVYISDETPLSLFEDILKKYRKEPSTTHAIEYWSIPTDTDFTHLPLDAVQSVVVDVVSADTHPYLKDFFKMCCDKSITVILTGSDKIPNPTNSWIEAEQEMLLALHAITYSRYDTYTWSVSHPKRTVTLPKDIMESKQE